MDQYYDGPGGYWYIRDLNGDGVEEQWVVTSEDASYGAPFDPSLNVYQWNAVDPESPNYHEGYTLGCCKERTYYFL